MLVIDLSMLKVLISTPQKSSAVSFAVWIVLGLLVGFFGSRVFNKTGYGLLRDCLVGVVGAIVAGLLSNLIGRLGASGPDVYSEVVAVVGALVFIFVYHALLRRRRFAT